MAEVCERAAWWIVMSLPSRVAPTAIFWIVRGRYPFDVNICCRARTSFTGRPTLRAAIAARMVCHQNDPLQPNPPPTNGEITCTLSGEMPNTCAQMARSATTACVVSYSVTLSPSHAAMLAWGFHGIMVFDGRGIRLLHLHGRNGKRVCGIAAPGLERLEAHERGRLVSMAHVLLDLYGRLFHLIVDDDQVGGVTRLLERFGHHDAQVLPVVMHDVVLQRRVRLARFAACRVFGSGRFSLGALRCVRMAKTPGAACARLRSKDLTRPLLIVLSIR